jgi:hypothetical protein
MADLRSTPAPITVSPSQGPVGGGTAAVIAGARFQSGASVSFGGVKASNVRFVNGTTLHVTTPAHAAGTVEVAVTNPNGRRGTLAASFTYESATSLPPDMAMPPSALDMGPPPPPPPPGAFEDEFVGPLPSWKNVKTTFGAKGDGVSDDTAAIQSAFNAIQGSVLYFPAGTYNISSTIVLNLTANEINAQIVGADPVTTVLRWTGASGGVMFQIGGLSFSKIGRITFDGAGKAGTLWYGDSGNVEGTSARGTQLMFFDDVFQNAGKGLIQGRTGSSSQDSEWTVLRCQFLNDSQAGASIESWNAGDFWFYWSTFKNCGYGIANGVWGGPMTFSVYGSNFFGSTNADISTRPMFMTIMNNFSSGSNQFLYENSNGNNSAEMYLQGNRILDTTNPLAIQSTGCGPLTMVDNVIRTKSGATGPAVQVQSGGCSSTGGSSIFSVGNKYAVSGAESVQGSSPRMFSIEGATVSYASVDSTVPTLPGTPTNHGRTITEITAGSTAAQIQTAINNALASTGQRPVIHLQGGSYSIASTLTVPANLDIQIIGDGHNTIVNWTGAAGGTLVKLQSPSKARLQDLYLRGSSASDALYIGSEDSSGARVQAEQVISSDGAGTYGLLVEGLTNTLVNFYGTSIQSGLTSVHSVVGTGVAGVPSRVACFGCGEGPGNAVSYPTDLYHVSNQGSMVVFEGWFEEASHTAILANLVNTSGNLTLLGGVAAANVSAGGPTINLDNFQGTFTLGSYDLWAGALRIANATAASNALVVGCRARARSGTSAAELWAGPYAGSGSEVMVGTFQSLSSGASPYTDQAQGTSLPLPQAFVDKMFALARNTVGTPNTALPAGVSDVQLSFVGIYGGSHSALHIKSGP